MDSKTCESMDVYDSERVDRTLSRPCAKIKSDDWILKTTFLLSYDFF